MQCSICNSVIFRLVPLPPLFAKIEKSYVHKLFRQNAKPGMIYMCFLRCYADAGTKITKSQSQVDVAKVSPSLAKRASSADHAPNKLVATTRLHFYLAIHFLSALLQSFCDHIFNESSVVYKPIIIQITRLSFLMHSPW